MMNETPVLTTDSLSKNFGKIRAVDHLDLQVNAGQVFGILGPNGSGKTTTLGMLLGVTQPTGGTYNWFGLGRGHKLRRRIGAILEHPIFYPYLSALDNLRICALIKEVPQPDYDGLLKMVGLYDRRKDNFKTYSLGMKQRLAIAASLVSDPDVLIFDEPTNGLDPEGIADIRNLIMQIAGTGKTIILASHLLDEVQKVCSHFVVLRSGQKIFQGSVEAVLSQRHRVEVDAGNREALRTALGENRGITAIEERATGYLCALSDDLSVEGLNRYLFERDIVASQLSVVRTSLEEQFLSILRHNDQGNKA